MLGERRQRSRSPRRNRPGRALLLPFDQFVFAECHAEEKEQQLHLVFATHEVVVRGHSLRRIETAMQRIELSHVACLPANYRSLVADGQPFIREIAVQEVNEAAGTQQGSPK